MNKETVEITVSDYKELIEIALTGLRASYSEIGTKYDKIINKHKLRLNHAISRAVEERR